MWRKLAQLIMPPPVLYLSVPFEIVLGWIEGDPRINPILVSALMADWSVALRL
jgi:hypothetical protein